MTRVFGGVRCKPVPSTGGTYWAGEDGSVWRGPRYTKAGLYRPERKMTQTVDGSAKLRGMRGAYVRVKICVGGIETCRLVHRLVAEAWLPDYHRLLEVHHVNGDPLDNRPANLACLTRAEHELAHGHDVRDVDVANCRYDFELHKDDPRPAPCPSAARGREYRRRSKRGRGTYGKLLRLAQQVRNMQAEAKRRGAEL